MANDPAATLDLLAEQAPRALELLDSGISTGPGPVGSRLLLLPELHLAALGPPLAARKPPEPVDIPGPLTDALGEIARTARIWLVPGSLFERGEGGRVHNTCVVLSPDGELVARYRKVFPWEPHETTAPGDSFEVFEMPGVGVVGLSICYDGSFPETARELAWRGAEVILSPSLTTTADRAQELVMARANAIFNQLYVVSLNAASPAGVGRSAIFDPEGLVRMEAGNSEEILTDVLDLDAVARVRRSGTAGVSRMWEQIQRVAPRLDLSIYRG